jgi:glycosyltransferase involved in cell wall biosynthesis
MIKLSIIIPVYNVEKYVSTCLKSVFTQDVSEAEYEVIVINDGTPDESMEFVSAFASKHKNLKIVEQANMGLSVARNEGLKIACGEYVWFVDSDDSIIENCLDEIFTLFNDYKSDVFVSSLITQDEVSGLFGERNIIQNLQARSMNGLDFLSLKTAFVPMQIYFIKRILIEKHFLKFYPGIFHEDKEFAPRLLYYANSVHLCEKPYYIYLLRSSGSITSSINIKHIEDQMKICYSLREFSLNNINEKRGKLVLNLIEISSLFFTIPQLNKIQNRKFTNKFLLKNIKYMRHKSVNALFSKNIRLMFFGFLVLLHPRLLMIYFKIR